MILAFCALLAVLLGALPGASGAQATADGPDFYALTGVVPADVLNMRAEPSAASAKIGAIPHDGRGLQNLGCQGGPTFAEWERMSTAQRERAAAKRWCKVRYGGNAGWVAGHFLREQ